jgi:hypothetical protein
MSEEYTEEEKRLADEILQDIEDGKSRSEINAKRCKLNLLYQQGRDIAKNKRIKKCQ